MNFDNSKKVVFVCNASPYGLRAVLSHEIPQGYRPIVIAFRSLSKAERNYRHIAKEILALLFELTKFHNYLLVAPSHFSQTIVP